MMNEKKFPAGPVPYVPDTGTKVVKKPPVAPDDIIFDLSLTELPFGANPAVAAAAAAASLPPWTWAWGAGLPELSASSLERLRQPPCSPPRPFRRAAICADRAHK